MAKHRYRVYLSTSADMDVDVPEGTDPEDVRLDDIDDDVYIEATAYAADDGLDPDQPQHLTEDCPGCGTA